MHRSSPIRWMRVVMVLKKIMHLCLKQEKEIIQTYTYTQMEYCYSAMKQNKILPFVTIWMDLEGTMLSDISQSGKDNV